MAYEWAETKAEANRSKHGVDFENVREFDWEKALVIPDVRVEYGEARFRALGRIRGRLHAMALVTRGGAVRLISLRKANERAVRIYETRD